MNAFLSDVNFPAGSGNPGQLPKNAPNNIPAHRRQSRSVVMSDKYLSIAIGNRQRYLWFAIHKNAKFFPHAGERSVFFAGRSATPKWLRNSSKRRERCLQQM